MIIIKRFLFIISLMVIILTFSTLPLDADNFSRTDQYNNLRLGNDYIVIVVNQQENARGRFAIETTGGAPLHEADREKPLVYGRPRPWTSYTTIKIDGENYVFGGSTERRAGRGAEYGENVTPPQIRNNSIYTSYRIDDFLVEQSLEIVKSSTTGLYDSVQITYRIINKSEETKEAGLRIMLDTMLGENDGAPFRIGERAITTDTMYEDDELPDFWQAFDSISSPQVTSQGNFKGPSVTTPDRAYFADWGSLADGSWNFDFNPGDEFIRKGEYEIDSAIALFWDEKEIKPEEEFVYSTTYGLGGITTVPGLLSLGVTSPAEVVMDKPDKGFPVIAYVENTSEIEAKNVNITLSLPDSFRTEEARKNLGDFAAGDISQVSWEVKPATASIPDNISYQVEVKADNTDSNRVERSVKFVGPPQIETNIKLGEELITDKGRLQPNPFTVEAYTNNSGGSNLYNAVAELSLPPGLSPAAGEKSRKYLGYLRKDEEVKINWQIKALPGIGGDLPFAVEVRGLNEYSSEDIERLNIPDRSPVAYLEEIKEGDYITYEVVGVNIDNVDQVEFTMEYNPENLQILYSAPGNLFAKGDKLLPWNEPRITEDGEILFDLELPISRDEGTFARLNFKIKNQEDASVSLDEVKFYEDGQEIDVIIEQIQERG